MAKSTHTSAAPRKQSTKPTPLPTRAKITNNQEKEESSSLFEVKSSESNVEFSDMPTSQPKKTDNNNRTVAQQTHSTDALASQNEHKDRKLKNPATSQLIGCPFDAKVIFQPDSNNWLFTCTNPAHNHPVENNIDTSNQPLTLEIKEEMKELLRNGMKPKKISEGLQPGYPNHQITAARIYELGKQIKTPETSRRFPCPTAP
ncbi:hypothetical protein KEM48_001442 [Puccinia striiformis f. sp. tritici PST-130]|uniref:FAR1 domain-containing protein n=1 Tax=Puccinia striiformis f. sp. tritici PST-78 TaxID=1165861 RepID=A0A0L0VSM0_9BASI|nr:hypothetical protein KEM48_001442 [Puccinia striiformis f. sp. tritici PST-130]KNF02212.1 hypothetical protein PSTG_04711 [Puccinia striiformis f. sp. tritici PST-78]